MPNQPNEDDDRPLSLEEAIALNASWDAAREKAIENSKKVDIYGNRIDTEGREEEARAKAAEAGASGAEAPPPEGDNTQSDLFGAKSNSPKSETRAVDFFNKRYFCVTIGDDYVVYDVALRQPLKLAAFIAKWRHSVITTSTFNPDGTTRTSKVEEGAKVYLRSNLRNNLDGLVFDPSYPPRAFLRQGIKTFYNTWEGWETVAQKPETVDEKRALKELLRFIYVIICDKNVDHFHWVCSWLADLVQHPEAPRGVALVLIGLKGVGKTFFAELICALLGERYSYITADRNDIFGPFSGHLAGLVFLVLEEAVWAANHQNEAILKHILTGKRRSSHAKHKDPKMIANYLHSVILANPGWVVPMSQDERRFSVLYPSTAKMQDRRHFAELARLRDNGGRSALMYFFKNYRIKVDVGAALKTQAGQDQMPLLTRWLLEEFLYTGIVKCCSIADDGSEMEIVKADMLQMFLDWCKMQGYRQKMSSMKFGIEVADHFPRFDAQGNKMKSANGRTIGIFAGEGTHVTAGKTYAFPSLYETRQILAKRLNRNISYWEGGGIKWEIDPNCSVFPKNDERDINDVDLDKVNEVARSTVFAHRTKH